MKLSQVTYLFVRVGQEIERMKVSMDTVWGGMMHHTTEWIETLKKQMQFSEQALKLNDPARQLKLGYSIVRSGEKIIKRRGDVKVDDKLQIQVSDGSITAEVEEIGLVR